MSVRMMMQGRKPAAGGGGYDPTFPSSITGLQLWLDASDSSTITLTGSRVSGWADKSSNAHAFTQTTDANRPTVASAAMNGLDVLRWATDRDCRLFGPAHSSLFGVASTFSIFVAYQNRVSGNRTFLSGYEPTILQRDSTFWPHTSRANITASASLPAAGLLGMLFDYGTGTHLIRYGSTQVGSQSLAGGAPATAALTEIGAWNDSNFYQGDIAEILVYDSILSGTNLTDVEAYFVDKWGITL